MIKLSEAVNGKRLWSRLMELGELGSTGDGGVNRQAMSELDAKAHILIAAWAMQLGADVSVDEFGNMFARLSPSGSDASAILVGSHLDTQPMGGRFDGAYGVVSGLEVLEAAKAAGASLNHAVELAVWNNEEGCRFSPTTMGSALATGHLGLKGILSNEDSEGITLADALAEFHHALRDYPRRTGKIAGQAYLEAHIEQGPLLEASGNSVAVVTGVQGIRQYRIVVRGAAAHAGTTPESMRNDAFVSALDLINRIRAQVGIEDDQLRFTVGSLKLEPNSINTVPHGCTFSIDLRHPREDVLDRSEAIISGQAQLTKDVSVAQLLNSPAISFDSQLKSSIAECARELGLSCDEFASGATHDAKLVAEIMPAGMIFIPCRGGLSHTPAEWAEPEHSIAGARLLAAVVERLGRSEKRSETFQFNGRSRFRE